MTLELRGRQVANEMQTEIQVDLLRWRTEGITPKVVTLLVGEDDASVYYAKSKAKVAARLGIEYEIQRFDADVSQDVVMDCIGRLNHDESVHAIMVELPLPAHIDTQDITQSIASYKDVDGLTNFNRVANATDQPGLYPATPLAAVRLLKHYGYTVSGKHVALVGCGQTVGQPLFHVLIRENATVTVCHAGTPDLSLHTLAADVIFVAAGKAGLITPGMVRKDHVIIDVGINKSATAGIVGDVDASVADKIEALSPTPGGVGTVTTMQLFQNVMHALNLQREAGVLGTRSCQERALVSI